MPDPVQDARRDAPIITRPREATGVRGRSALRYIPAFAALLVVFVVLKLLGVDMHAPLVGGGDYTLTTASIVTVVAAGMAMLEMLKVSEPGVNNIAEAIGMNVTAVVYLVLFLLAAGNVSILGLLPPRVFANSEFLILSLMALTEGVMGLVINSRTLVRQMVDTRFD
jgi:hypothetical protein